MTVPIHGDKVTEANEAFTLDLNQTGSTATIGDGSGTATLINDDAKPVIKIGDASVAEGNSGTKPMIFHVSLNHASASPITVHYTTVDGSAKAGSDYVGTNRHGHLRARPAEQEHHRADQGRQAEGKERVLHRDALQPHQRRHQRPQRFRRHPQQRLIPFERRGRGTASAVPALHVGALLNRRTARSERVNSKPRERCIRCPNFVAYKRLLT